MDLNIKNLPNDSRKAVRFIVDTLTSSVYPLLKRISDKLHYQIKDEIPDENFTHIRNVYTLCADQVKKCILTLFDIIKIEYQQEIYLQESRQCTIERICWCIQKLASIEQLLEKPLTDILDTSHEFTTISSMYFVNWIDQTFDILGKFSNVISKNDFKKMDELSNEWKMELVECVRGLHTAVDELLLCAMTLCKHCLPGDQYVVKARCQVVLRETKTLLSELIEGDSDTVPATIETLKLPIMPFNINVRIDVLKDVLYVLETNTNTALLALVVHCFTQDVSPVDILMDHFENSSKTCTCGAAGDGSDVTETCTVIKDFDLYNDRLFQIGSFAMSCSSDQKRVLDLRSGLASLEALEPHLVPAATLCARSPHARLLAATWRRETALIRDSVFLIVDPAAFADKARQMMHQSLLEILKDNNHYENSKTCSVINIGCVVYTFFEVYEKWEPEALTCHEQLAPLLRDLNKVQIECKIVSNLLSSSKEHKFDVKDSKNTTNPTFQQLVKRLKLLYTLVKRINLLYNPRENDDEFYEEPLESKYVTQTYNKYATYVNSPRKQTQNLSKSVFARTNMRCSTGKFPLAILTKHMKARNKTDLSFSIKLDGLCDVSELKLNREPSILYRTPLKTKSSLRKVVLCKQRALPCGNTKSDKTELESSGMEKESVLDDAMSLQITDVLNQINDLTFNASTTTWHALNSTVSIEKPAENNLDLTSNVLKLSINNDATFKRLWNITINSSVADYEPTSNMTQPSEVNTLERINDLDLLESRLSDLKSEHTETRNLGRHNSCFLISITTLVLAYSIYIDQVAGLPPEASSNPWPTFPRRNVAALARDGYLRSASPGYKRSISTLAKNGQLPTFTAPFDETDKQEQDEEASPEKRNLASIARMRSYSAMKRNIQALARDGYRFGRSQNSQPNDKRNIAALARNGLIHKRDEMIGDEYYYPFYQNQLPPLSEITRPLDYNEIYDLQQSINPDMLPPLSQVFKRSDVSFSPDPDAMQSKMDYDDNWYLKRGSFGLPAHGLYRPIYIETSGNVRNRRSIYSLPDVIDRNDINVPEDYDNANEDKRSVDEDDDVTRENFEKRHIGSLARLGLLPSFRFTGGRYSRSGRARLLLPSQELYRKHSSDENFGIREYLSDSEADTPIDSDDTDLPPPPVPAHTHPTGRYLHRPLNNDLPNAPLPQPPLLLNYPDTLPKNRWQSKDNSKYYYFRSSKVPYHSSGKRYLLLPAVDNILLRKAYRNSSLPSRRKNQ
ncbi:uncharacterized protein [Maniola hyperantus]|uniref:uncharacterized protein n=1 Tax=Aphantopus hyperantus TaxID=2795564 RepID=UPI00374999B2